MLIMKVLQRAKAKRLITRLFIYKRTVLFLWVLNRFLLIKHNVDIYRKVNMVTPLLVPVYSNSQKLRDILYLIQADFEQMSKLWGETWWLWAFLNCMVADLLGFKIKLFSPSNQKVSVLEILLVLIAKLG